jgi:hypothetical protein
MNTKRQNLDSPFLSIYNASKCRMSLKINDGQQVHMNEISFRMTEQDKPPNVSQIAAWIGFFSPSMLRVL